MKTSLGKIFVSESVIAKIFGCMVISLLYAYILYYYSRIVKATSPWLNVVLLIGIMIRLPATLLFGLSISANHYPALMGKDLTPVCNVRAQVLTCM